MTTQKPKIITAVKLGLLLTLTLVGTQVFNATNLDAEVTSAKVELKTDGSLPFDSSEGKGADTGANNQIVRSYDEVTYDVSFAVNSKSQALSVMSMTEYDEKKIARSGNLYDVEVTLQLPKNTDVNKIALTWETGNFKPEDVKLSSDKSSLTFYVRNIGVGQLYTKGVIMKVQDVGEGLVIKPEASIKIVGSSDTVNLSADKEVRTTVNTNMNARVTGGLTSNKVEVNGKEGRLHQFVIALGSHGQIADSRRGIGLPSGPIEYILDFKTSAKNISTGEMKDINLPVEFFHTAPNGGKDTFNQPIGSHGYPIGTSGYDVATVAGGGKYKVETLGNNKFKVTVNDYVINGHFPIYNWGGDRVEGRPHYKQDFLNFSSQAFEFFVPFYGNNDASYDVYSEVKIESVKYADPLGNTYTEERTTGDNTNTKHLPEYLPGSISVSSYTEGKPKPVWTSGNATAQQGETLTITHMGHITSGADAYKGGAEMLQLFDGRQYEFISSGGLWSSSLYNNIDDETTWYGVGIVDESIMLKGIPNVNHLEWFNSLAEAKANEKPNESKYVTAVYLDTKTSVQGQGWPHIRSNFKVKVRPNVPVDTYMVNRTYFKTYRDVARTQPVGWVSGNQYTPSRLDENGNLVSGTHSPASNHGGNTTKVIPYETRVGMEILTKENGKEKVNYQLKDGNVFDLKFSGSTNSLGGSMQDNLILKLVVPSGLNILEDTFSKPIHNKIDNPDGSKTYEFLYETPHNNVFTPVTCKISIPLTTEDRTQFLIKSIVYAEGDKRNEELYRTSSKTISVIADASMQIVKTVNKALVEVGEDFEYTLTYANNSDKDYSNGVFLDILPHKGNKSNYQGFYTVSEVKVPEGVTIEGTNTPSNEIKNDPLNNGVTDWKPIVPGEMITAIRFRVPSVKQRTENSIKIKLQPVDNLRGNIYYNSFKASLQGLDLPLISNTVETRVISRDVTGSVWSDNNNNGINNNTGNNPEQQLTGIDVELLDANNNVLETTRTDSNGTYTFYDVKVGSYKVRFKNPEGGLKPTKVPSETSENTNHISDTNLTSEVFNLIASDSIKVINLGVISSVSINKTLDAQIVNIGDEVKYTLAINNQGGFTVDETTIVDDLPRGVDVVESSISDGGVYDKTKHRITWNLTNLRPNAKDSVDFKVVVSEGTIGKIQNVASVKANNRLPEVPSNEVEFTVLEYNKRSSVPYEKTLNPGQEFTYFIDVINKSGVDATNVSVEDNLSGKLNINLDSISDGGGYNKLTHKVSWNINVPANSTKTLQFKVSPKLPAELREDIPNTALVNGNETNEVLNQVGRPVLEIRKSVDKTTVREQEEITYSITVMNTGTADSANISLEDAIPEGSSLVENSHDSNLEVGVLKWNLGIIKPGESVKKEFKVTSNNLPTGTIEGVISNKAEITHKGESLESNIVNTKVVKPQLEISKTTNKTELLTVDEEILYSINVRNTGTVSEKNVIIKDSVPEFTELVTVLNNGVESQGNITWDLGELGVNQERTVYFRVKTLQKPDSTSWIISNTALVNEIETNEVTNQVAIGDLVFNKEVDKTVATVGDTLTYSINVSNVGDYVLRNIQVKDTVPEGTFGNVNPNWTIKELQAGETETLSFKVKVSDLKDNLTEDVILNTATVNGEETNEVQTVVQIPKLEFVKRSSVPYEDKLRVGDKIEYFIDITNIGSATATDILVEDNAPENTSLINTGTAKKKLFRNSLAWKIDEIQPGETVTVSFLVQTLDNKDTDNNTWELTNTALVNKIKTNEIKNQVSRPILNIEKSVNKTSALENDVLTYTLNITNSGDISSNGLTINDNVSNKLKVNSESISNDGVLNGSSIRWKINTIEKDDTLVLSFDCIVKELPTGIFEDTIPNIAKMVHDKDVDISSNEVVTKITKPNLVHKKTVKASSENVTVGDELDYTINVINKGTAPALNTKIVDIAPEGTELINGDVVKVIEKLLPGESESLNFTVRVLPKDNEETSWRIINTALVNDEPTNEVVTPVSIPKLKIEKIVDRDDLLTLEEGLNYEIQVTNIGENIAKDFEIRSKENPHVAILDVDKDGNFSDKEIIWKDSNLKPNETRSYNINTKTVWLDGILDNFESNASVQLKDPGVSETLNSNFVENEIAIPTLKVAKTSGVIDADNLAEGDEINYEIEVTNEGAYVARNVKIIDELPEGLQLVNGQKASVDLGNIQPNETVKHSFRTIIKPLPENEYTKVYSNIATVISDNYDEVKSNEVQNTVSKGELVFSKYASIPNGTNVNYLEEFEYFIKVKNKGDRELSNISVVDKLPQGVTYLESTGDYDALTHTYTALIDKLEPKEEITLSIKVKVNVKEGVLENIALINNQPSNVVVNNIVSPRLTINKSAEIESNNVVLGGDTIKYTLTIKNEGAGMTRPELPIIVKDILPQETELLEISNSGNFSEETNEIRWNLGSIAPQDSTEVSFTVKVNDTSDMDIRNIASVLYDEVEVKSNETIHYLRHNKLSFRKTVDKPRYITTGEELLYTIEVANEGTVVERNILITDIIPKNTDLLKIFNNGSKTKNGVEWNIDKLESGESTKVTFLVKVKEDINDKTVITNKALVNNMETNEVQNEVNVKNTELPKLPQTGGKLVTPTLVIVALVSITTAVIYSRKRK